MKTNYNTNIVRRFMSAEEFETFNKRYEDAKKKTAAKKLELTPQDIEMVAAYKRGVDMAEIRRQYNMSDAKILKRVATAVRHSLV